MGKDKKTKKGKKGILVELHPVSGTRDFPPNEFKVREWLFDQWRKVARSFAFEEYDAPILEHQELYKRKAGEDITKEMYAFEDNSKAEVALRPEMTPSLARILLKQVSSIVMPIRWFSIPQCWRYETLTRGRRREHFQWNMDIFGVNQVTAEAELIAAICTFFQAVGLDEKEITIKVSSRRLIQVILNGLGVTNEEEFGKVCVIADKLDKLGVDEVKKQLGELGISPQVVDAIILCMGMKGAEGLTALKSLSSISEVLGDVNADAEIAELETLFKTISSYGYAGYVTFDASVVRGLAYYTGVVFEAFWTNGNLNRAICGGGRYDKLLSLYGGKDVPAVGFGFGDCVILEILKERNLIPELKSRVDDVVFAYSENERQAATQVVMKLRRAGRSADIIMTKKKIPWAYNYADRVGASRVVLVAPDEWEKGYVKVKYLLEGTKENRIERVVLFQDIAMDAEALKNLPQTAFEKEEEERKQQKAEK